MFHVIWRKHVDPWALNLGRKHRCRSELHGKKGRADAGHWPRCESTWSRHGGNPRYRQFQWIVIPFENGGLSHWKWGFNVWSSLNWTFEDFEGYTGIPVYPISKTNPSKTAVQGDPRAQHRPVFVCEGSEAQCLTVRCWSASTLVTDLEPVYIYIYTHIFGNISYHACAYIYIYTHTHMTYLHCIFIQNILHTYLSIYLSNLILSYLILSTYIHWDE